MKSSRTFRRIVLVAVFGFVGWRLSSALPGAGGGQGSSTGTLVRDDRANREYFVGTAMGCRVTITIDANDPVLSKAAARAAFVELDRLEAILSDWKSTSALSEWNDSRELRANTPREMSTLLTRALEVARASDGRFDPTVAPVVALWRESQATGALPSRTTLEEARARVGFEMVRVERDVDARDVIVRDREDIRLDFGGIGKGYGAVCALEILRAEGCPRAMVAIAGDLAIGEPPRGEPGWKVDIETATEPLRIIVSKCAVSTSGDTEQWIEIDGVRYAHIIDPRTGLGARRAARATVIGPLDASVDALGTALSLCNTDAEVNSVLQSFSGFGARLERDETSPSSVTLHGSWSSRIK